VRRVKLLFTARKEIFHAELRRRGPRRSSRKKVRRRKRLVSGSQTDLGRSRSQWFAGDFPERRGAASPRSKQYSPQSHGDTEKNKVKGKTRAHGGDGGHGGARSTRISLSSYFLFWKIVAVRDSRDQTERDWGRFENLLQPAEISSIRIAEFAVPFAALRLGERSPLCVPAAPAGSR
jgi:hypothetical protein